MAVVSPEVLFRLKAEFRGQSELDKAITSTQKLQKGFDNVGRAAQRQARVANDNTKATNRNRMAFNQIGFQINDFSTQMQNGAKFSTAFSQQIGQLGFAMSMLGGKVGILGALLGGIGGTVISLAVMFGSQLFGGVKDSEKATLDITKAMDLAALSASELTEVTGLLRKANGEYREETVKNLGNQLDVIRGNLKSAEAALAAAEAGYEQAAALRAVRIASSPTAGKLLDPNDIFPDEAKKRIETATERVGLLQTQFRGLQADYIDYIQTTSQSQFIQDRLNEQLNTARREYQSGAIDLAEFTNKTREYRRAAEEATKALEGDTETSATSRRANELTQLQKGLNGISEAVTNLQRRFESGAITEAQYTQGLANQLVLRDRLNEEHKTGIDILNEYASTADSAAKKERDLMAERFTALVEMNDEIRANQINAIKSRGAEAREEAKNLEQSFVAIGTTISGIFKGLITGAQSFGDAIKSVIGSVIDELFRLFVVQQIVGFVTGGLGGLFGGGGKLPKRAMGGPVAKGQSYLVGERGPEIFTANRSGMIIPNHKLGGGTGGMVINVDARGSTDPAAVKAQVQQGILEAAPSIIAAAQSKTVNSLRRPRLAGAL